MSPRMSGRRSPGAALRGRPERRWTDRALLSLALLAFASLPPAAAAAPATLPGLNAFVDEVMTDALERYRIPGAAVAVVSGGEVVLLEGYGLADVERRIPVDPERTVFRAFSVSKPVTATAVMQLFDRGLLRPDDDVTRHLEGLPLRRAFPQPVTAGQLLTHTSGFTDRGAGTVALHPENVKTLEQYLADRPYRQVYPPGQRAAYSDYNFALAGYLVERVSGIPFPRFAEETVFRPLGMSRTTFLQPRPGTRVPEHAVGYAYAGGRYEPQPPAYYQAYPASGMLTTASDMARFMLAHLSGGRYAGAVILSPFTRKLMHQQQFTPLPPLSGLTYGFWTETSHGRAVLMHTGAGTGFSSMLYLLPDEKVGVFIAANRRNLPFHYAFIRRFMDRYFPAPVRPPPRTPPGRPDLGRFTGTYIWHRYDPSTIEKIIREEVSVRANADGTLTLLPEGGRYIPVGPLLFRRTDGDNYLAFETDPSGRVVRLNTGRWAWTYDRARSYETRPLLFGLVGMVNLVFTAVLAAAVLRRVRRRRIDDTPPAERWVRALTVAMSALNLVFTAVIFALVPDIDAGRATMFDEGWPPAVTALLAIPLVTAVCAAGLAAGTAVAWARRWPLARRLEYTVVLLAAAGFTWAAYQLNLLGWHY